MLCSSYGDWKRRAYIRRISVRVTAQTAYNLGKLAAMCGHRDLGRVIDKLTREKMISLGEWRK